MKQNSEPFKLIIDNGTYKKNLVGGKEFFPD